MKKLLSAVVLAVVMSGIAFAFDVSQSKTSLKGFPGDRLVAGFTLSSDHDEIVRLYPTTLTGWYMLSDYIVQLSNSSKQYSLIINIPKDTRSASYLLRIVADNGTESRKMDWIIGVDDGTYRKLSFSKLSAPETAEPGSEFRLGAKLENLGNVDMYNVKISLYDIGKKLIDKYYVADLKAGASWSAEENVSVPWNATPGKYTILAEATWNGRKAAERSVNVNVPEKRSLDKSSRFSVLPFGIEKITHYRNLGNVPENVSETRGAGLLGRLAITTNGRFEGSKVVWNASLKPGEEAEFRYGINFLPLMLIALAIAVAVFAAYTFMFSPSVKKTVMKKGKGVQVIIEVKNRSMVELKSVVVRDRLIPIFKPSALEKPKPRIKKGKKFTALTWVIPKLLPGEERIFRYEAEFVLGVKGKLKLPPAEMHAKVGDRKVYATTGNVSAEL